MRIAILGAPTGLSGGPSSFRAALERSLRIEGHILVEDGASRIAKPDAILVIGGTRHLGRLVRLRLTGCAIVLRLDGVPTAGASALSASARLKQFGRLLSILFTKAFLATSIVYQSEYSHRAWRDLPFGTFAQPPSTVVHNGTELDLFRPSSLKIPQIAVVEGSISAIDHGIELLSKISGKFRQQGRDETFLICGRINPDDQRRLETLTNVRVMGPLSRTRLSEEVGRSQVMLSLEHAPSCPNAVIESLAAGTPVVGFETGAMPELIDATCGALVVERVGADRASDESVRLLTESLVRVIDDRDRMAAAARHRSETRFDINEVAVRYVQVMSK